MPYYITDQQSDCSGWATVKETADGSLDTIGCHETKQDAIDQMIAVSIAENIEPGGERAVSFSLPEYIKDAARKGIELYEEGLGGGGLVSRTIREARLMASGEISEDKVIRANAWAARHIVDLDSPKNSNPDHEDFPGAGAVAFYLWGVNPLDPEPAMRWFGNKAEQIKNEEREAIRFVPGGNLFHMDDKGLETRRITLNDFEMRASAEGDGMTFSGYAAVFNSDSEPLPFTERIMPGAFAKSLRSRNDIRMYLNHDTGRVLASRRAGTLRLNEDQHGLFVEADLPPTTDGRDLSILMQRGDVDSMSFGFSVPSGGDKWSPDGNTRELREVRLHEVSVVTGFPAYTATVASVRSLTDLEATAGLDPDMIAMVVAKLSNGDSLSADESALLAKIISELTDAGESMDSEDAMPMAESDEMPGMMSGEDDGSEPKVKIEVEIALRNRQRELDLLMRRL